MRRAGRGAVLGLFSVVVVWPAFAQAPACVTGPGMVTVASIGTDVMQDGVGVGTVRLGGSVADLERAWGAPWQCVSDRVALTYTYVLTDGSDPNGLLVGVLTEHARVTAIVAMLMPHAGSRGPSVRSGRGVALLAPLNDVRAAYGAPANTDVLTYPADGVAFVPSGDMVAGIWIFPPNVLPYALRRR